MTTQPAEALTPDAIEAILDQAVADLDIHDQVVVNRHALAIALGLSVEGGQPYPADELAASMARHPAGKGQASGRPPLHAVAPTPSGEVRITSATGGQKGSKEAAYDLIPSGPLRELAILFGRGNIKYPPPPGKPANWKLGYNWSLSKAALLRHFELFWAGEDYDEEMGVKHVICVIWHAMVLAWFMENRPQFDDRSVEPETYVGALPTPQWLTDLVLARAAEDMEQDQS